MKIWIGDICSHPEGYVCVRSVKQAKDIIECIEEYFDIKLIEIGYDASNNYTSYFEDDTEILKWLEETGRNFPIKISLNTPDIKNMMDIIEKNGWILKQKGNE